MILAIDPGVNAIGWAVLYGPFGCDVRHIEVVACGLLRPKSLLQANLQARDLNDEIRKLRNPQGFPLGAPDPLVIEEPQSYTERVKQKGPQGDLISVALYGGVVAGVFDCVSMRAIKPREWKGQTKKHITKHRVDKRLSVAEKRLLEAVQPPSLRHNCVDAVAIGLWQAGRLGQ